ncbi:MAG: hypothetical protein IJO91_05565 [Oscillospiraceae bacterium]|nr:hypothetical protein [Oscillospiraceae bacterium]
MKNFPNNIPDISISRLDKQSLPVVCEEVRGWFVIPKLGERSEFAVYDTLTGNRVCAIETEATNKAIVHGIQGVEIAANAFRADGTVRKTQLIVQLSDIRCGFLAFFDQDGDTKRYLTFYDDEISGHDVNEYGSETHIRQESFAIRDDYDDYTIDFSVKERTIVGQYEVKINDRIFDTTCVIQADEFSDRVLIEQYIDKNGRTVLQREFMSDSMMMEDGMNIGFRSEHYPCTIKINGSNYVCTAVAVTDLAI